MIQFKRTGGPYGDATSRYELVFRKEYTVKEFVEWCLTQDEWGSIGIHDPEQAWFQRGNPYCEYNRGTLKSNMPRKFINKKIEKATASGGWSNMDYILHLKE